MSRTVSILAIGGGGGGDGEGGGDGGGGDGGGRDGGDGGDDCLAGQERITTELHLGCHLSSGCFLY